jgi:hypothetical protein
LPVGVGAASHVEADGLLVEGAEAVEHCSNEPAIGFYRSIGALAMDEWTTNRLTGDALRALATDGYHPAP